MSRWTSLLYYFSDVDNDYVDIRLGIWRKAQYQHGWTRVRSLSLDFFSFEVSFFFLLFFVSFCLVWLVSG